MLQIHSDGVLRNQNWNGYVIADNTVLLAHPKTPVLHIPIPTNASLPINNDGKPLNLIVVNIGKIFQWTFFVYDDNLPRAVQNVRDFAVSIHLSHADSLSDVVVVSKNTLKAV